MLTHGSLALDETAGWGGRQNSSQQLLCGQRSTKQSLSKPNSWPLRWVPSFHLLFIQQEVSDAAVSPRQADSQPLYLYQERVCVVCFFKEETLPLNLFPEDSHGHLTLCSSGFSPRDVKSGVKAPRSVKVVQGFQTSQWPQWSTYCHAQKSLAQAEATQSRFYH